MTTTKKFTAPTTRMEDVFFTTGTNKEAANFNETKKRLARYVGTCNYRGAATAPLVIETMTNPTFTATSRPAFSRLGWSGFCIAMNVGFIIISMTSDDVAAPR